MLNRTRLFWMTLTALTIVGLTIVIASSIAPAPESATAFGPPVKVDTDRQYIVLSWNDLGMHCYNRDFNDLAVLPPANTLWAQVIKVGNPPQVITTGVTVEYSFPTNTYSVGKSNFWSPNPNSGPNNGVQNAEALFGVNLADNMGLAGNGLSGQMAREGDHFMAEWIPLTEYNDSDWASRDPYQLAQVVVKDASTQAELARETVVAPVSTEMRCDRCHSDNGEGNEGIHTGVVEQNILTKHDRDNQGDYPPGHTGSLMGRRPVLCAECHSSNAIGAPGQPGIPSLSKAMHSQHREEISNTTAGCYNCHPGPTTLCLRDVMSAQGMGCVDCHGTMQQVSQNPSPWLNEPKCVTCHNQTDGSGQPLYGQDQALYRMSSGHGGVYCEGCHDSTHAIAPSTQPRDALKFIDLQGHTGALDTCLVCHSVMPTGAGPHGILPPIVPDFAFAPDHNRAAEPGAMVIYTHTLTNTGSLSDTYSITWASSQGWATVTAPSPVTLDPGQSRVMTVTVDVPAANSRGLTDTTTLTATSELSATHILKVIDTTSVLPALHDFAFAPDHASAPEPGATVVYTHSLENTGNVSDTYSIEWTSSQGWAAVTAPAVISLDPGQVRVMTVTVDVPSTNSRGLTDTTILTATSTFSPTQSLSAKDVTLVPVTRVYLPIVLR
jgi:hypothetical protein